MSTSYTLRSHTPDLSTRFDYIARDTKVMSDIASSICTDRFVTEVYYLLLPLIHRPRLINCARVIEDQICYDIKDANMLFELCHTRYSLHKLIYSHKTGKVWESIDTFPLSPSAQARAIEYMLVDALLAAEPVMHFADHITKPEKYLHLTDTIVELIQVSEDQVSSVPLISWSGLTVSRTLQKHRGS